MALVYDRARVRRLKDDLHTLSQAIHYESASILIPKFCENRFNPLAAKIVYGNMILADLYRPERGWVRPEEFTSPDASAPEPEEEIGNCAAMIEALAAELPERTMGRLKWETHDETAAALEPPTAYLDSDSPHYLIVAYGQVYTALLAAIDGLTVSDRRHTVPVLLFHDNIDDALTLMLVQRHGITACTLTLDRDPHLFIHLLLVLFCSGPGGVGYDETIQHSPRRTGPSVMNVNGVQYDLLDRLTGIDGQLGRGTHCWKARSHATGQIVVIKDFWFNHGRSGSPIESEMLQQVSGIPGVPEFIAAAGVRGSNMLVDAYPLHMDVEQIRIVSSPFAAPLKSFRSRREVLNVMKDVNLSLFYLARRKVLHGDTSPNNICIAPATAKSGRRTGLLIDFGYSRPENGRNSYSGTPVYVARALQRTPHARQTCLHDLESLFYVLLFICIRYTGPEGRRTYDDGSKANGLPELFNVRSMNVQDEDLGDVKWILFSSERIFENCLRMDVTPYFEDFKPLLRDLRRLLFPDHEIDTERIHEQLNEAFERCELLLEPEEADEDIAESEYDPEEWMERHPWASEQAQIDAGVITLQYPDQPAPELDEPEISDVGLEAGQSDDDAAPNPPPSLKRKATDNAAESDDASDSDSEEPDENRKRGSGSPPRKRLRNSTPFADVGNEGSSSDSEPLCYPPEWEYGWTPSIPEAPSDELQEERRPGSVQWAYCVIA